MLLLLLDFKKVKQAAERAWIEKVVSKSIASHVASNYEKTETAATEESSYVKENLESTSENIANSIKGLLGARVKHAIKTEVDKINDLY